MDTPLLSQRRTPAEDESCNGDVIPDLKTLALRVIMSTWKSNLEDAPCADKDVLMKKLQTNLLFELAITRIDNDYYWEKAAKNRWKHNDPAEHGDSWRQLYCERHLAEYLETLEASYYEARREECEKLMTLVKDHVHILRLRSLIPTKKQSKQAVEVENELLPKEDIAHHIPMATVLPQLPCLTEIYLNFGMIYTNDGFDWYAFKFSIDDCISLGEGIKTCPNLRKFILTRSSLDQPRVAAILQGMASSRNIEELNLSHCKLMDTGAHAVGEFLLMNQNLKTLRLTNNNIGPIGLAGVIYGILNSTSICLKNLDLRLNPLEDEGANHVCALLVRNESLETLNISGCKLSPEAGVALTEVLTSGYVKLETLHLDVSNNDFGPSIGESFKAAVMSCPYIIHLDGRMCNFSKESEYSINENTYRNKQNIKKEKDKAAFHRKSSTEAAPNAKSPQQQAEVEPSFSM